MGPVLPPAPPPPPSPPAPAVDARGGPSRRTFLTLAAAGGLLVVLLAVAAFVYARGPELPRTLGGAPRIEGDVGQAYEDLVLAFLPEDARAFGSAASLSVGVYGPTLEPSYLLMAFDEPLGGSLGEAPRSFVDFVRRTGGTMGGGTTIDPDASVWRRRPQMQAVCFPVDDPVLTFMCVFDDPSGSGLIMSFRRLTQIEMLDLVDEAARAI